MISPAAFLKREFENPRVNLVAGLTVAVVALPLALAFGSASGLGPRSGLITAVIAGIIAALFGGSRFQVSGPTGAMTVVLLPIFATHGTDGVLVTGLLAGLILIVASLLKLGSHVHRIPTAIIEGFTAGIAVVIALQQVPNAIAVHVSQPHQVWANAWIAISHWNQASAGALVIALITMLIVLVGERYFRRLPLALIAVAIGTGLAHILFSDLVLIGTIPDLLSPPSLKFLNNAQFVALIPAALAVAALAALESLLSAKVADRLANSESHHDSDRELFGQGLANLVVPLFGGVPATAALARTAVNVRSGGNRRSAAALHSVFLAVIVLATPGLVSQIPLAALSGVLFATCYRMVKPSELISLARESKLDALLLVSTFVLTIAFDLVSAVLIGLVLFILLRRTGLANVERRYPPVDRKERLGD
ncbi:MAG: SulP family inorganic anion transporter [Micrococcales bacterium]